jgi:hypothetical protein
LIKIAEAVASSIRDLPEAVRGHPLAAAATLLAARLDSGTASDRDVVGLVAQLRMTLADLRELAGVGDRELEEFLHNVSASTVRDAAV